MIYFDNAATTKISSNSLNEYVKASECFFNPSALYENAMEAKKLIQEAREFFLLKLNGKQGSTLIFTSGATEANNAVLNSMITRKDKKYIFSAGEHSSIYETAKQYQQKGYNIVFVPLVSNGQVDQEKLFAELDETVAGVSIIYVSNETGAINDIEYITKKIKKFNPNIIVHTDGVQAVGKVEINLKKLDVDYFTLSAHKINGPKGVGALYVAKPSVFKPFLIGGGQEMNLRSGTENIPGIVAFKKALEDVVCVDYSGYKTEIIQNLTGDFVLVSDNNCVDNIISICFKGVRGETLLHMLEERGFLIGTGSACNSKAKVNRVLTGIVDRAYLEGAIRISFGSDVSLEDCRNLAKNLSECVALYRERIRK